MWQNNLEKIHQETQDEILAGDFKAGAFSK